MLPLGLNFTHLMAEMGDGYNDCDFVGMAFIFAPQGDFFFTKRNLCVVE